MNVQRELDVKKEYPYINKESLEHIQAYYDRDIRTIKSSSSFQGYMYSFRVICNMINKEDVLPLRDWNEDIVRQYIGTLNYSASQIGLILRILKRILNECGCNADLKQIKSNEFITQYKSDLLTLDDLENRMTKRFKETHPQHNWDSVNDWSSTIVLCYLLWLGLSKKEVSNLKKSDYHEETEAFVVSSPYGKRIIQLTPYSTMTKYIKSYANSSGFSMYNEYHKERLIHYVESDSFLKYVFAFGGMSFEMVENYGRNIIDHFGYQPEEILLAGRLNKLYNINLLQNNILPVTLKNGEAISKVLGLKKINCIRKESEVGTIITKYPDYKRIRELRQKLNDSIA